MAAEDTDKSEKDYKDTLNLPQTAFPMKGNLAQREPELLAEWEKADLHGQIARARKGGPRFILHDGPPYTSGDIHYGHILNKVLKDLVVKYRTMTGYSSPYVPGWDTHGLPIELQVERDLGAQKAQMSQLEVRKICHQHAMKWMNVQRTQFKRLGVFGSWDTPYLTLDPGYERAIVRALAAFARGGFLYRGKKPVHWCISCRTALAEAEIEYHEHTSHSIYVRLPLEDAGLGGQLDTALAGKPLSLVIWTTTPWTLPANLAVVMHPELEYVAIPSGQGAEHYVVARGLAERFLAAIKLDAPESTWIAIPHARLRTFEGARYRHPFVSPPRADKDFRVRFADHVTLEAGTGLVHTAPGHGEEDYHVGLAHGLDTYAPVDDAGRFTADVPIWAGKKTTDANHEIVAWLAEHGALLNDPEDKISHSYPHCWRCKHPVLFRATPQWFLELDHADLRQRALAEIDKTQWIPPWGRNRIYGMIEHRPDWCLSRQRAWGVPIPVFYCEGCEAPLVDAGVMEHVAEIFGQHGADVWFERDAAALLPAGTTCGTCGKRAFRKEQAIVDVWFESGVSWFAVCEPNPDLGVPVDLYLEGSDQHRGWFHSSLLAGLGVAGRAPFKAVLTHGFVLDERGKPYSKSEIERARKAGHKIEYIDPAQLIGQQGAELLRAWVASVEFRGDMSYSKTILGHLGESYRKYRNTCRFVLGNLADFQPERDLVPDDELPALDRWALARLDDFVARVREAYESYEFHTVFRAIVDYVTVDLSAFYADVTKDRLYCDGPGWRSRRAAQTVMWRIGRALATLAAPILCFTAEDVWRHLPHAADDPDSVHLALMPSGARLDEASPLAKRFGRLSFYRERAIAAIEPFRAQKHHPLDARVTIRPLADDRALLVGHEDELADLFVVSQVAIGPDAAGAEPELTVDQAPGTRCPRCWKYHLGPDALDARCARVMAERDQGGAGAAQGGAA
jgi:isoleucyl-tRNA synthetase